MFMNKRFKPRKLYLIDATLQRTSPNHPNLQVVEEDKRKAEAGFVGEQRLDSVLEYLSTKDFSILRDLNLKIAHHHFQLDSLLFHKKIPIVIETKNMKGELELDKKMNQLVQKKEDGLNVYENPVFQAQFQARLLKEWLFHNKFPIIQIEYLVMMSNPNCLLKGKNSQGDLDRVCRGRSLIYHIEDLINRQRKEILNEDVMKKMCKLLVKNQSYPEYDIEKIYRISRSELRPGVFCPSCHHLGMTYHQGKWFCPKCLCKSNDAHLAALRDYFLLYGPKITNHQLREFLLLSSSETAYFLLKKLKLKSTGSNKYRVYQLSWKHFSNL